MKCPPIIVADKNTRFHREDKPLLREGGNSETAEANQTTVKGEVESNNFGTNVQRLEAKRKVQVQPRTGRQRGGIQTENPSAG